MTKAYLQTNLAGLQAASAYLTALDAGIERFNREAQQRRDDPCHPYHQLQVSHELAATVPAAVLIAKGEANPTLSGWDKCYALWQQQQRERAKFIAELDRTREARAQALADAEMAAADKAYLYSLPPVPRSKAN